MKGILPQGQNHCEPNAWHPSRFRAVFLPVAKAAFSNGQCFLKPLEKKLHQKLLDITRENYR
ncbi:hypothetical protein [Komagataeibacter xylinus]|uniref:hypothetical protein n=1 Tax=Komagataeibacter xylinus TaxID=28448 RepID=UPI000B1CBAC5|nr:hypothetical protein [Komagataeibacter xylinus]